MGKDDIGSGEVYEEEQGWAGFGVEESLDVVELSGVWGGGKFRCCWCSARGKGISVHEQLSSR